MLLTYLLKYILSMMALMYAIGIFLNAMFGIFDYKHDSHRGRKDK